MATTLLILLAIWAVTFPAVLVLARVLGRLSGPRSLPVEDPAAGAEERERADNVVPLVPRPQNELVGPRRRAA